MPPVFPLLKVAAVLLHGVYIRYRHVLESGGQSRTINAHPLWFQNRLPCLMRASSSTALFVSVLWATIRGGRDKPYASLRVIGTGSLSMPLFPFLDELTQLPETSLPPAPSAEEFVPCGIDIDAVTRPGAPRPPSGRTVPGGFRVEFQLSGNSDYLCFIFRRFCAVGSISSFQPAEHSVEVLFANDSRHNESCGPAEALVGP